MRNNLLSCARGHERKKCTQSLVQPSATIHICAADAMQNVKNRKKETRISFMANNCSSVEARKLNRTSNSPTNFFWTRKNFNSFRCLNSSAGPFTNENWNNFHHLERECVFIIWLRTSSAFTKFYHRHRGQKRNVSGFFSVRNQNMLNSCWNTTLLRTNVSSIVRIFIVYQSMKSTLNFHSQMQCSG